MTVRYTFVGAFSAVIMDAVHSVETEVTRALAEIDGKPRPVDEPGTTVVIEPGDQITLPDETVVSPDLFVAVTPAAAPADKKAKAVSAAVTKKEIV
jgi:hypothetical protein